MLGESDIGAFERKAFDALWFAEHVVGEKAMGHPLLRRSFDTTRRALRNHIGRQLAKRGPGRVLPIEERRDLGPEEFGEEYLRHARPVVLRGAAAKWECCLKWSPQWFADAYGDDAMQIIHLEQDWNRDHKIEDSTLREVIGSMGSGAMKYARFVPLFARHPELFEHFDLEFLAAYVGRPIKLWGDDGDGIGLRSQCFIGERGTTTSLHNAMSNNIFIQCHGRKLWTIIPPAYNAVINPPVLRTPGYFAAFLDPTRPNPDEFWMFEHCDRYEVTLEEGDVFYNPPFYWHHVYNPVDSIGIGIRWYWKVSAEAACRTQNRLAFMATNPTMEEHLQQNDDFTASFAKARAL